MGRKPCCPKEGLNRGAWTAMEDDILVSYIKNHGEGKWGSLPKRAGLKRCGKSCRLRWLNYLRPGIKRGNISDDEEELIIRLHRLLGNRWSLIAGRLPGRTDNEIKNYWNTTLSKKVRGDGSRPKNQADASPGRWPEPIETKSDAAARRRSPEPEASPVRAKALRCTRLPVVPHATPPVSHRRAHEEQTAAEAEPAMDVQLEQQGCLPEDGLSPVDLDFDMGELGFLSPWRGDDGGAVAGGMGPDGQFGGAEAELEALLLGAGGGHGHDHHSLGDFEFAWF
ncbi:hypothetical protein ACP70R_048595 [Stipagrostis hirtigluma subsp. patula]